MATWDLTVERYNFGDVPDDIEKFVTFKAPKSILLVDLLKKFREAGASSWKGDLELARSLGMQIGAPGEQAAADIGPDDDEKWTPLPSEYTTKRAVDVGFVPTGKPYRFSQLPPGACD